MVWKISVFQAATHTLVVAHIGDKVGDVHRKICEHNSVVVIDTNGDLRGILSRKDVVRAIVNRRDWQNIPVAELMTKEVLYIPNHVSLAEAAKTMLEHDVHQLVITGPPEGGLRAIGIVTLQDILKHVV